MFALRSTYLGIMLSALCASSAGAASVTFLQTDAATLGNWKGVYGQDGNVIAQHSVLVPSYSNFNTAGAVSLYLLDLWATDPRALLKQYPSYSQSERIESYFHTITSMDFLIGGDASSHRIALYFADYENRGRSVTVQALDTATGAMLDTRSLANYQAGVYLVYNYTGNVTFRVVNNNPGQFNPTGSVNAFFWGGGNGGGTPPPPPPSDNTPPSVNITAPAGGSVSGTVSLTANASDNVGVSSVQFQLDGGNLGSALSAAPYSFSWNTLGTSNGSHTLTAVAKDAAGNSATSAPVTVTVANTAPPPPPPSSNSAQFVTADTATLGNWKGVYGQDGNIIAQHSIQVPSYATFDTAGNIGLNLVDLWATDPRALLKQFPSYSATERIESYFQTTSSMDFKVGSQDGQSHKIALYFADYERAGRAATISVLDATTGAVLDQRAASYAPAYMVYTYSGNVVFRVASQAPAGGPVATLSGIFWGGGSGTPPPPPPSDTTPPSVSIAAPAAGATVSGSVAINAAASDNVGVASVQFQIDGSNFGGPVTSAPFTISWDTTATGNGSHTIAAIAKDAAGNSATASVAVNVSNTVTPPPPPPPPPTGGTSVAFLGTDSHTQGNWKGVYGQDGNVIAQHSFASPSYSGMNAVNTGLLLVTDNTTDVRAPLKYAFSFSPTERIMSLWYNRFTMDFQVNTNDGQQHRIALYFADFTPLPPLASFYPDLRTVTVQALNTDTGELLDTRVLNDYTTGVYLVYNYKGNVTFRVVNNWDGAREHPNGAMSAVFWGGTGLP